MTDLIQLTATTIPEAYAQIKAHFERDDAELAKQSIDGCALVCGFRVNGNKCAVGVLIRDEDYREDLELQGGLDAMLMEGGYFSLQPDTPLARFLSDAQHQHDLAATVDGFLASMDSRMRRVNYNA